MLIRPPSRSISRTSFAMKVSEVCGNIRIRYARVGSFGTTSRLARSSSRVPSVASAPAALAACAVRIEKPGRRAFGAVERRYAGGVRDISVAEEPHDLRCHAVRREVVGIEHPHEVQVGEKPRADALLSAGTGSRDDERLLLPAQHFAQ